MVQEEKNALFPFFFEILYLTNVYILNFAQEFNIDVNTVFKYFDGRIFLFAFSFHFYTKILQFLDTNTKDLNSIELYRLKNFKIVRSWRK